MQVCGVGQKPWSTGGFVIRYIVLLHVYLSKVDLKMSDKCLNYLGTPVIVFFVYSWQLS